MKAPFAGGVGTIAKDILLDLVVIKNGSSANRKRGAKLERERETMGYETGGEEEGGGR